MKQARYTVIGLLLAAGLFLFGNSLYTVSETEQVIITEFGRPLGEPITEPGLHFRKPFIQTVNSFDKRLLRWEGAENQITTQDKKYILVDTTARWRISDPLEFFKTVKDISGAQSRLDDMLDSNTRDAIASHYLPEAVRSSNRELVMTELLTEEDVGPEVLKIDVGRSKINEIIRGRSAADLEQFGIELVDFRIKRINYIGEVQQQVFERMISERERIAQKTRSEGRGRATSIDGDREKEIKRILSVAYKEAEVQRGKADARAASIYAESFGVDPDFYQFITTLKLWQGSLDEETTLMLSTESEILKLFEGLDND